jgi:hypothetical protein
MWGKRSEAMDEAADAKPHAGPYRSSYKLAFKAPLHDLLFDCPWQHCCAGRYGKGVDCCNFSGRNYNWALGIHLNWVK